MPSRSKQRIIFNKKNPFSLKTGAVKTNRGQPEARLQRACVLFMREAFPGIIFTSTLGGLRIGFKQGKALVPHGYCKGIPDLLILHPRFDLQLAGLGIEFKSAKGRVSSDQKELHAKLKKTHWRVETCRTLDQFVLAVTDYILD
jgi:hypothetical protein